MTQKALFRPLALLAAACILAALSLGLAHAAHAGSGSEDAPSFDGVPSFLQTFDGLEPELAPVIARTLAADVPDAYHVTEAAGGSYRTANPAHGMQIAFTPAGPRVSGSGDPSTPDGTSASGQATWTWGMSLTGWGYDGAIQPVGQPTHTGADQSRFEYHYRPPQPFDGVYPDEGRAQDKSNLQPPTSNLVEWYLNTTWGLEQGFTIAAPPESPTSSLQHPTSNFQSPIILELALTGSLHPQLTDDTTLLLTDASGQTIARYAGLYAHDANGTSLPAHLSLSPGGEGETLRITVDPTHATYPITIDPWLQRAKLTASDGAKYDWLGYSVAVSGDTVVVGAPGDDGDRGSAYVFVKPGGGWGNDTPQQAKLTASDGAEGDEFGTSVTVSGDTVVVGAPGDDTWEGSAYVFVKPGSGWGNDTPQQAKLTASDGMLLDMFGYSVAVSGDTVVVGALGDDDACPWDLSCSSGSAYVFVKPVGGWVDAWQTAKLTASDGAARDQFGTSVTVSGDTVVVGAPGDDDNGSYSGSAYVFVKPGGGWSYGTQTAKLLASDGAEGDEFGTSVAVSGDTVVIGAPLDDTAPGSGSAYVFVKPGGGWVNRTQTAKLTASDGWDDGEKDLFGTSVDISGDTVVVGEPAGRFCGYDPHCDSGSAYVYLKPVGGWVDTWQTAKLTASDDAAYDRFGYSVAVSGGTVVVGAPSDDDACPTDPYCNSGSAYVFAEISDVALHKAVGPAVTDPGQPITYTLTFYNAGHAAVATHVVITDIIPVSVTTTSVVSTGVAITDTGASPGYVWRVQDLAPGQGGAITVTGILTTSLLPAQTFTNTATAAGIFNGPWINTASAAVAMHGADLALGKSVNDPLPYAGDIITYTLTVANRGPDDTTWVEIGDALPSGITYLSSDATQGTYFWFNSAWNVGSLAAGASATLDLVAQVNPGTPSGTRITNTAVISVSDQADGITGNNTARAVIELAHAELAVGKTGAPDPVVAGERLTYTLVVTNHGPIDATGVVLTDTLPGSASFVSTSPGCSESGGIVVCTVGELANQATRAYTIAVTAPATRGLITNTATVGGADPDINPSNDGATERTWVSEEADLAVAKRDSVDPVVAGAALTYTLVVTNGGPDWAGGMVLTDVLPSGVTVAGPVLALHLDEAAGATHFEDGSGFGHHVSCITCPTAGVSGRYGQGVQFDGSDDWIEGPDFDIGDDFTIGLWVNPDTVDDGQAFIAKNTAAGDNIVVFGFYSGGYLCHLRSVAHDEGTKTVGWQHLVAVGRKIDPSHTEVTVYKDGQLLWQSTLNAVVGDATGKGWAIGQEWDPSGMSDFFSGAMDEIVIYNRALSAREVAALYQGNYQSRFSASQGTCTFPGDGTELACDLGVLAPGAVATVTLPVHVSLAQAEPLVNTTHVSGYVPDPDSDDNTATETTAVLRPADLAVGKTGAPDPVVVAAARLTYTLAVTNHGPNDATGVVLADTLPGDVSFLSASPGCGDDGGGVVACTVGGLANGATRAFTIAVTAPVTRGLITNTVTVAGNDPDQNPFNDAAIERTRVSEEADLVVGKGDAVDPVVAGATLTYTLVVTNGGPDWAGGVVLTDALPSGAAYAGPVLSLHLDEAAGATHFADDSGFGHHAFCITCPTSGVSGPYGPAVQFDGSDDWIEGPDFDIGDDFTIGVWVDPDTVADQQAFIAKHTVGGDNIVVFGFYGGGYRFHVRNLYHVEGTKTLGWQHLVAVGRKTDSAHTEVRVYKDGQLLWQSTLNVVVGDATGKGWAIGQEWDPSGMSDFFGGAMDEVVIYNRALSDLEVAALYHNSSRDPRFVASQGACSAPDNSGELMCDLGSLAPGAVATVTLPVRVSSAQTETLSNTAGVSGIVPEPDPDDGDNVAVETTAVQVQADLAVGKRATPDPGLMWRPITYTVAITNYGPSDAQDVLLTDTLQGALMWGEIAPSQGSCGTVSGDTFTCTLGTMRGGDLAQVSLVVTPTAAGRLTNTVRIAGDAFDLIASNNAVTRTTGVGEIDLALSKTVNADHLSEGSTVTYTILLTNYGPSAAASAVVSDALPGGISLSAHSATHGTYTPATGVWDVGALAVDQAATLTITGTVGAGTAGQTLTNTAVLSASQPVDIVTRNNAASAIITVADADLGLNKTVDNSFLNPGDAITYTITVANHGPDGTSDVVISDTLPPGVTYASHSASPPTIYTPTTGVWSVGDLATGQAATLTLQATVDAGTFGQTVVNTAVVSGSAQGDSVASNDGAGAAIWVNTPPTAIDDVATTNEDGPVMVYVLDNDTDLESWPKVVSYDASATVGTVTDYGFDTFEYDPDGQFEALAAGEQDLDTFTYIVADTGGLTDTATVTVTIEGSNDAPTTRDDSGSTDEDTPVTVSVLANDTDPDTSDILSVVSVGVSSTLGTVTDDGDGTLDYDPDEQFEHLTAGEQATDTFSYVASDGALTATAIVVITITGVNDAPTISNILNQRTDSGVAVGPVPFTVSDAETSAASLTLGTASSNQGLLPDGNIALGGSGADRTIALFPTAGMTGTATITVTVSDGDLSAYDTFVLAVGVNAPPEFTSTPVEMAIVDMPYTYTVTAYDADPGDVLTITAPVPPTWLTLTQVSTRTATLSGTPVTAGTYPVALQVTDGEDAAALTDTQAFTISVTSSPIPGLRVYLPLVLRND